MCKPSEDQLKDSSLLQPKSWNEYVSFAGWMIYKKLLVALLILLIVLFAVVLVWLLRAKPEPEPQGIPVYYYFDELLKLYSGEVIIINETDEAIYRGQVQNGLRSGWGKSLFARDGSTMYEGEFRGDLYEGQGMLFDAQSAAIYTGQFANGLYHGQGILFEKDKKKYEGSFANGLPDGEGVLYDESESIRYQGGFARGLREGDGLEIDHTGNPIYKGEFREDLYDGQGVLYTTGGSRLNFEGAFVRGTPSRSGKIYNPQGQLLYDGPVLYGKVDCIGLLGLGASDWKALVTEKPVVYFGYGFVGYLYAELGISAIGLYSLEESKSDTNEGSYTMDHATEYEAPNMETEQQELVLPFSSDDIIFHTMLIEGAQYSEQIPIEDSAKSNLDKINGFEAFMSSRLAAVTDPLAKVGVVAEVKRIDDSTYEVTGLPETVDFKGDCYYRNLIYYYYGNKYLAKGGVADIIHCNKKQFGG